MPSSNPSTPPVLPTYGNSACQIPVSGIAPSGGNYPGPHFVQTQSMNIKYMRVPNFVPTGKSFSLSATPITYKITSTYLLPIVEASYRVVKDMNTYSTSGCQQNQKFAVIPETTDPYGNSYDSTSGLGASAIGPMGEIVTQYDWYYRRPWKELTDTEVDRYANGSTWFMGTYRYALGGGGTPCWDGTTGQGMSITPSAADWNKAQDFSRLNDGWGDIEPRMRDWTILFPQADSCAAENYPLQGTYNPNNESPEQIQGWVDLLGAVVAGRLVSPSYTPLLYGLGDDFQTLLDPNNPKCAPTAFPSEGFSEYSTARHDWS